MTRARSRGEADLHARFERWLIDGPGETPPRDVALHAAYCDGCRRSVAALDALAFVDPGRATLPPSRQSGGAAPARAAAALRVAAAGAMVVLIGTAGLVGASLLQSPSGTGRTAAPETPAQEVLGGTGRTSDVPSPSPATLTPDPSVDAGASTATPAPIDEPPSPEPAPPTPPPSTPRPVTATPLPSVAPTATPTTAPTPEPTPQATPEPTPTPNPTPTPAPGDCADGIDNDGDGLIDFGDGLSPPDPGCLVDGHEASA